MRHPLHPFGPAAIFALFIATASLAKKIELKINLGGNAVDGFLPEEEVLELAPQFAKMRYHGDIQGSGTDLEVFKTQRFSRAEDLIINIPVPDGVYSVTMLFAETWKGAYGPGKRVFDAYLGSKPGGVIKVIDGMDPFRSGGPAGPVRRKFDGIATQGGLTVALRPIQQNPQIAGITISGFSYPDVLIEDLPTAPAEPADVQDFSVLRSVGPRLPTDPSLIYDPMQNPKFKQTTNSQVGQAPSAYNAAVMAGHRTAPPQTQMLSSPSIPTAPTGGVLPPQGFPLPSGQAYGGPGYSAQQQSMPMDSRPGYPPSMYLTNLGTVPAPRTVARMPYGMGTVRMKTETGSARYLERMRFTPAGAMHRQTSKEHQNLHVYNRRHLSSLSPESENAYPGEIPSAVSYGYGSGDATESSSQSDQMQLRQTFMANQNDMKPRDARYGMPVRGYEEVSGDAMSGPRSGRVSDEADVAGSHSMTLPAQSTSVVHGNMHNYDQELRVVHQALVEHGSAPQPPQPPQPPRPNGGAASGFSGPPQRQNAPPNNDLMDGRTAYRSEFTTQSSETQEANRDAAWPDSPASVRGKAVFRGSGSVPGSFKSHTSSVFQSSSAPTDPTDPMFSDSLQKRSDFTDHNSISVAPERSFRASSPVSARISNDAAPNAKDSEFPQTVPSAETWHGVKAYLNNAKNGLHERTGAPVNEKWSGYAQTDGQASEVQGGALQPGGEYGFQSTRSAVPMSMEDQSSGVHNGNRNLDGICLNNSTHCSCGMVEPSPEAQEECLFVVHEEAQPMVCVKRACSGRVVCACAPGANSLCHRASVDTILVPIATPRRSEGDGQDTVLCKREGLEHSVPVLTPIM